MKKKTPLIVAGILLLLIIVAGGIVAITRNGSSEPVVESEPTKKRANDPINTLPVAERPVLSIKPEADGRNVTISIVSQKKSATEVEYELEYQAGSLLQGAFGKIAIDALPISEKILLGSCSAGGACTYHTEVQGGTLLTRYTDDPTYTLKSDWRYFDNSAKSSEIASRDAKFQLTSPEIAKQRYIIVFNAPGYPDGLEGTIVSDLYSLNSSSTLKGTADLTLRASEEGATHIAVWDGAEWTYIEATVDGKTLTAEVPLAQQYLAVTK